MPANKNSNFFRNLFSALFILSVRLYLRPPRQLGSAKILKPEVLNGQDVFDLLSCGALAVVTEAQVTWQPKADASSQTLSEAR